MQRSEMMRRVRRTDTGPELIVRRMLHALGFRFRLYDGQLPGRPDLVLPRYRSVVFVHGCFWHRHARCKLASHPATNVEFWQAKFAANKRRDRRNERALEQLGWRVIVVWQCETLQPETLARRLKRELRAPASQRRDGRMRTVELFAGIGGFRIAAERLGHRTVWANDLCPLATRVYRERFGLKALCEGDIRELLDDIPLHDLLTAGFPCQPFSAAGKKRGIEDPRGTLFSVIVDVLRRRQPPYFVLENVKRLLAMDRGMHFATILASLAELDYRIEWRLLNAMHFGLPQNRQRVFLIGVRGGGMKEKEAEIRLASPNDLQSASVDPAALDRRQTWREIADHASRFPNWGLARAGRFYAVELDAFAERLPAVSLRSVLEPEVDRAFDFTHSTRERIRASQPVRRMVDGVEILSNQRGGARMGYTVFGVNGVSPTLTSTTSRHYERYRIGRRYRRLTNVEYARIQGFPDDHCAAASVYDQYALLGNAVPPPLAGWVMRRLTVEKNHAKDA